MSDEGELIRWGNTLKRWREPILNHFDNGTTSGFIEGCNTKIKMLKLGSYGLRNLEVHWRKMLLGLCHLLAVSTQFDKEPERSAEAEIHG